MTKQCHVVDGVRAGDLPATREATFNPALAPLSVGTDKCCCASSWSPADRASARTGTSPADDTRFGSSNTADAAGQESTQRVMVDIDDTIIEVHGYAKQGSGYGYSGVRGLNALLATVSTNDTAPLVVAQRLRKGSCGSPRGAKRLVADALKTTHQHTGASSLRPLVRADSAFYGHPSIAAALKAGADVSVTVRLDNRIKAAITTIVQDAWTPIEYTDALYDEGSRTWISRAEVTEIPFTAFAAQKKTNHVPGRLVVRRIPDLNPGSKDGQDTLFDTWRFHAFFTTTAPAVADTVAADKTHRGHAIIEQVHADLENSPASTGRPRRPAQSSPQVGCRCRPQPA